jgi:molybdate transport system substrate-binding protein
MNRRLSGTGLLAIGAAVLLLTSCGVGGASTGRAAGGDAPEGRLTVMAAASLTEAFDDIVAAFEARYDEVDVEVSFDGSSRLAAAIVEGAPADVFASADEANVDEVIDAGLVAGAPVVFATNALEIVVAAGNPRGVATLADLEGGLRVALCRPEVPCGAYATQAFARAGLARPPAGDQESVKGVLTQVQLGEADAGIVYATDVLSAEGVQGVELPASQQVEASYPAVVLSDGSNRAAAAAFVRFLRSGPAEAILLDHGFGLP